ncbi:ABC transporter permease [Rhodopila sp.]|uniref:ABC transporter permease n=1 Tax=Rhodopila sp. TaxID=2480087 RepID=UPI003D0AC633
MFVSQSGIAVTAKGPARRGATTRGLAVQTHVVGALLMRELHTRFGRDNIGYLWAVFEPGLLALAVTLLHLAASSRTGFGMDPIPFWVVGYTPFCMFRFMVLRAEAAIESNRTLLYHRMVTITDLLIARNLLEFASAAMAMAILVGGAWLCGLGNLPDRPLLMFAGMAQLWWLSFGLSLIVAAASENSTVVQRIIHPATYVSLPLSGAFFLLKWIPHPWREYLTWSPLISPFEQIREGQFASFDSAYVYPTYVIGWSLVLTILGLVAIRITRRRMHLD